MDEQNNSPEHRQFDEQDSAQNNQQPFGYEQIPDSDQMPPVNRIQMTYEQARSLKTIQRQALASGVCGLVSLFIGGIALSTAGLIVALLGMKKVKSYDATDTRIVDFLGKLKRLLVSSLIVCVVGLGLNAYAVATAWPDMMEAVQTQDVSHLLDRGTSADKASSNDNASSTWG